MSSMPADLLLVSPAPQDTLSLLGDGLADVTVASGAPGDVDAARHDVVLLSGAVTVEVVAGLAAELGHHAMTLAVDLTAPPTIAALEPLRAHYEGSFARWGALPVLLVEPSGTRHVDPAALASLAAVLGAPASSPQADPLALTALAHADAEQARLQERVEQLRERLEQSRSRTGQLAAERDRAREHAQSLERHVGVRATRAARRIAGRVPGGRKGLLALLLLAVLIGLAVAVLVVLGDLDALAVAVCAIGAGVVLNLLVSVVLLRQGRATTEASPELRTLVRGQRQLASELRGLRTGLDRHRAATKVNHRNINEKVNKLSSGLAADRNRRPLERAQTLAQIQETVRLFTSFPVSAGVPPMGGWAASADLVGALVDEFLERRPDLVVECGSGVSTLWLATAARQHGVTTRIVALEHDAHYAEQTRALLARHGLGDIAEVRHAPLRFNDVDGTDRFWYDVSAVADLTGIGLLFVDGPPAAVGEHARFPALPLLQDRLAERCSIVLDDMIRTDEQEVAQLWHDRLPDLSRTDLRLEKGATIFRRG